MALSFLTCIAIAIFEDRCAMVRSLGSPRAIEAACWFVKEIEDIADVLYDESQLCQINRNKRVHVLIDSCRGLSLEESCLPGYCRFGKPAMERLRARHSLHKALRPVRLE